MKKTLIQKIFILASFVLAPSSAFSATFSIDNPLTGVNSIQGLIAKVLEFVVKVGTIVVVFAIIWTGFLFIKAQGNAEKLKEAREALLWTVVGGVILIGAQVLATVICNTAGQLGAKVSC